MWLTLSLILIRSITAGWWDDIVSGVKAGVEEGVREGVKKGVLEGLSESLDLGFPQDQVKERQKDFEEILRDVVVDEVRKQVKRSMKSEICPLIHKQLEDLCESALDKIRDHKIRVNAGALEEIKKVDISRLMSVKKAEVGERIKEHLPQDHILYSVIR
ncbi:MAG: hypothetical protein KBONHNOK_00455 [Candidatus Methanoperedenaceae archaeon GB50]|nr:MAG: hypothetical protein KBONHNOK_00455 [Candidatus Methanoperedenaceae archaeon GB50]